MGRRGTPHPLGIVYNVPDQPSRVNRPLIAALAAVCFFAYAAPGADADHVEWDGITDFTTNADPNRSHWEYHWYTPNIVSTIVSYYTTAYPDNDHFLPMFARVCLLYTSPSPRD